MSRGKALVLSDFYEICEAFDGVADVYLFPPGGDALVVQNVEITEGLELDIREHFYMWCDKGEPV